MTAYTLISCIYIIAMLLFILHLDSTGVAIIIIINLRMANVNTNSFVFIRLCLCDSHLISNQIYIGVQYLISLHDCSFAHYSIRTSVVGVATSCRRLRFSSQVLALGE